MYRKKRFLNISIKNPNDISYVCKMHFTIPTACLYEARRTVLFYYKIERKIHLSWMFSYDIHVYRKKCFLNISVKHPTEMYFLWKLRHLHKSLTRRIRLYDAILRTIKKHIAGLIPYVRVLYDNHSQLYPSHIVRKPQNGLLLRISEFRLVS